MNRTLDVSATIKALTAAGLDVEPILSRDPNTRRLLEALCVRYNVLPVYREVQP